MPVIYMHSVITIFDHCYGYHAPVHDVQLAAHMEECNPIPRDDGYITCETESLCYTFAVDIACVENNVCIAVVFVFFNRYAQFVQHCILHYYQEFCGNVERRCCRLYAMCYVNASIGSYDGYSVCVGNAATHIVCVYT